MCPMSESGRNLNVPNVLVNVPNLPNMLRVPMWSKSECAQCPQCAQIRVKIFCRNKLIKIRSLEKLMEKCDYREVEMK